MASPTANYSWTLPADGQDPWYTTFDTLMSAIDVSVRSVQNLASTRAYLVVSATPAASFTMAGSSTVANWTTLSMAAYGACVGSFAIYGQGAYARIDIDTTRYLVGSATIVPPGALVQYRAVVNPGSITVAESHWLQLLQAGVDHRHYYSSAVTSLGVGNFSATFQSRIFLPASAVHSSIGYTPWNYFRGWVSEVHSR